MARAELDGAKGIKSVTGLGLMIGIECEKPAGLVVEEALKKGVIALTAHGKVRLVPPLTITEEELISAIKILKEVIAQ